MDTSTLFFDIDTQYDFMEPEGALYVPDAAEIIPLVKSLHEYARERGILVLSSVDAHEEDDPEFSDFPPHCVKGTPGQQKIPGTLAEKNIVLGVEEKEGLDPGEYQQIIVQKQTFDAFTNPNTDTIIKRISPEIIYLFGVATDYCVKNTALSASRHGYAVKVFEDTIRGVAEETTAQALEEMKEQGIQFVDSTILLEQY